MRECPDCGSENVEPEVADFSGFLHSSINKWKCIECGYIGLMPEKESEKEDTEEVLDESGPGLDLYQKIIIFTVCLFVIWMMFLLF